LNFNKFFSYFGMIFGKREMRREKGEERRKN
jgi:hypothetical protein